VAESENVTIKFIGDATGLKGAATEAASEIKKVDAAADQLGGGLQKASRQVDGMGQSLKSLELAQVGQQLGQLGSQLNNFTGQALAATAALDAAQKKLSTIAPDAQAFNEGVGELAKSLQNQASTTELTNAAYDVYSSGAQNAAQANAVLEASVKGAVGGFSDVNTVADAATSVLSSYKLSFEDAGSIVDKFIATQNKGKITVGQYAQQIGKVAPIAAQAGISLDELNGFIATATASGVRVESSFTGFLQAVSATLKPSSQAAEKAKELGIQFDAQALRTKGLKGILEELNKIGADTPDVLVELFGSVEAVGAIAPSAGAGLKTLSANIEASANAAGSAEAAFNTIATSFDSQMKAAFNEANLALVELGKGVATASVPLIETLTFLIQNFNALPAPVKQAVGVILALGGGALTLAGAIAAVAAIVPTIVGGFGAISAAGAFMTGTTITLTGATAGLTAAFGTLGAAALALLPVLVALAGAYAIVKVN